MELQYRNLIVCGACGAVFSLAWWLMIDILALYPEVSAFKHGLLYLPIFLSSASLFINSVISNSTLTENLTLTRTIFIQRLIFFLSTAVGFAGVLAAVIICVLKSAASLPTYALVGIPLANLLILVANLTFKFCVVEENGDYY